MLADVTPVILTRNEKENIARTLSALAWARRVCVVDSLSDDGTVELARGFPNVVLFSRPFTSHADQWSFGIHETGIETEWVLALDADYVVPPALVSEIAALSPPPAVAGYRAGFRYLLDGVPLRGSLYPPVTVLYRRRLARYEQHGHTQRVRVEGRIESLAARIDHDDRKPWSRWLHSQRRYARLEAEWLRGRPWAELRWQDRLRRAVVVTPWAVPLHCLLSGKLLLDGVPGIRYAMQRAIAELLLSRELLRGPRSERRSRAS